MEDMDDMDELSLRGAHVKTISVLLNLKKCLILPMRCVIESVRGQNAPIAVLKTSLVVDTYGGVAW